MYKTLIFVGVNWFTACYRKSKNKKIRIMRKRFEPQLEIEYLIIKGKRRTGNWMFGYLMSEGDNPPVGIARISTIFRVVTDSAGEY
ncbi:MAG: hypothetical protein LBG28_10860 [Tannerella sp.]|jgi:hypothetical protein|nr:hypothetical protein [Tannerella sp.]